MSIWQCEETRADRSVQPTEGAVEVTGAHYPTRPGTVTGMTTGPSDPTAATDGFEVSPETLNRVVPGLLVRWSIPFWPVAIREGG